MDRERKQGRARKGREKKLLKGKREGVRRERRSEEEIDA